MDNCFQYITIQTKNWHVGNMSIPNSTGDIVFVTVSEGITYVAWSCQKSSVVILFLYYMFITIHS